MKPTIIVEEVSNTVDPKRKIKADPSKFYIFNPPKKIKNAQIIKIKQLKDLIKNKKIKDNPTVIRKRLDSTDAPAHLEPKLIIPKLKAAPAPDFKAMHEKEAQKMESIDSYANRKQDRYTKLTEKKTLSVPSPVPLTNSNAEARESAPTDAKQPSQLNKPKIKTPSSSSTTTLKHQPLFSKKTPSSFQTPQNLPKLLQPQPGPCSAIFQSY